METALICQGVRVWRGFLLFIPRIRERFTFTLNDVSYSYRICDVETDIKPDRDNGTTVCTVTLYGRDDQRDTPKIRAICEVCNQSKDPYGCRCNQKSR